MLRSIYKYKGSHARTLSFVPNENFLEIGISSDTNWIHVISEKGNLGFVPINYVAVDHVPPNEMLNLIDCCIESIHLLSSEKGGNYDRNEYEALQVLVEKRQEWFSKVPPSTHPSKRPAPPPPNRSSSQLSVDSGDSDVAALPSPSQPPPPFPYDSRTSKPGREDSGIEEATSFIVKQNSIDSDCSSKIIKIVSSPKISQNSISIASHISSLSKCIPNDYYRNIVEDVRGSTNISYSASHEVVGLVLKSLGSTFPSLNSLFQEILISKSTPEMRGMSHSNSWEESGDGRRLVEILEKLRQCKDDDQQRSWALHEDEHMLTALLDDFIDVLTNGDVEACKKVLVIEDHRPLLTAVQFYQMETRWPLRKLLLQAFAAVCQMSAVNVSYLSSSILPLELSRVLLHSKTTEEELQYTSLVLGMLLSMADTLPYTHFSIMNETFINEILEGIEMYNKYPETEGLAELYLTLLLAFNLQNHTKHKKKDSENMVVSVLASRTTTKQFIEKLLLLFNREEDPVVMFDHEPKPPHSVLCMMTDIFVCPQTAKLLYTNDEKVVCDIILRQITDLPLDDFRRHEYLMLLEGVIVLGHWKEHQHRKKEFVSRFDSILSHDNFNSDHQVIERIIHSIPELKIC